MHAHDTGRAPQPLFRGDAGGADGLDIFLRDDRSPLYRHGLVARSSPNTSRGWRPPSPAGATGSASWSSSASRAPRAAFRCSRTCWNWKTTAARPRERLAAIPAADELRAEMADFILRHKEFPGALQKIDGRAALSRRRARTGDRLRAVHAAADDQGLGQSEDRCGPIYLVHWGAFDGTANLPLVYMATVEDSSRAMVEAAGRRATASSNRRGRDPAAGRRPAQSGAGAPLRRLRREELGLLAVAGDDRRQSRQGFRDAASQAVAPHRARAVLFGRHHREQFDRSREVLSKVRKPENAWLLTWTIQEVYLQGREAGRKGLWSSEPAREEFHINTDDLEAARQGVSSLREARADPARGLPGALCRRARRRRSLPATRCTSCRTGR